MYVSEINFNKSEKINKNSEIPNINVNKGHGSFWQKKKPTLPNTHIAHHLILSLMKSHINVPYFLHIGKF